MKTLRKYVWGMAIGLASLSSYAAPELMEPIRAQCITDGTDVTGAGKHCEHQQCAKAPKDHVVVKDGPKAVRISVNSRNGGHSFVTYSDDVEVVPNTGIYAPTKVCVTARANSQAGLDHINARGWEDVTANWYVSKYH